MDKQPFLIHNHTEMSNFRLKDCINKVEDLLDTSLELGLDGICITDHEALSAHVRAYQHKNNNPQFKDFKLGFGNEIYLVDRDEVERKKGNNERIQFYHCVLLAKNTKGYKAIRELSTLAWKNSFYYRGMQRVPLYYDQLFEIMEQYKGDVILSTACVGGFLPQSLLTSAKYSEWGNTITDEEQQAAKQSVHWFYSTMKKYFGEDFYVELQPSDREVQDKANELLYESAKCYNVKPIITTDTHYLTKEVQDVHRAYLKSQEGSREVDTFYSTTYLMNREHLERFYFRDNKALLDELIENTREIYDKLEDIEMGSPTQITAAHIPNNYKPATMFDKYRDTHPNIAKMLDSQYEVDRYYMRLLEDGFIELNQKETEENIDRIELEVTQLVKLTEYFKQSMASYFVFTKEIIDLIWEISIIAPNRGSAACYYTNYLLGIVQVNPLDYDLPYWRFLHIARGEEMPDVDIDSAAHLRPDVIELIKNTYGHDKVLPMATYTTEGNASTVLTVCRGLGIDNIVADSIRDTLTDDDMYTQFYGNKEKGIKPNHALIAKTRQHKEHDLRKHFLYINGLISGRSQHASGVVIFNNGYVNDGLAMMKTDKGLDVTCFNADEVDFLGGLKVDILSTDALTRIMTTLDLLQENNIIEDKGSLRQTYNHYLHPDILDYDNQDMYDMLYHGDVLSVFQFSTNVGSEAIRKVKATSFNDLAVANSLMRLSVDGREQPIDKFVRFKANIQEWYNEMDEYGLSKEEQQFLADRLEQNNGIADTQELLMILSMDVAGYTLTEANKFRKLVAKADKKALDKEYTTYISKGKELNRSMNLLDYVWDNCFSHMFGYAFSNPHVVGYTIISVQEMNLCYFYTPLYWQAACLIVDSGALDDTKAVDYGAIARAVNQIRDKITVPDINLSGNTFTPDPDTKQILFGIQPIRSLTKDSIAAIQQHRPFSSFDDFITRMVDTKIISPKQTIILIKSGIFNRVEQRSSWDIMVGFVNYIVKDKDKITMTQFPKLYEANLLDLNAYKEHYILYNFRKKLRSKQKPKANFYQYFLENYSQYVKYTYNDDGSLQIDKKDFETFYDNKMDVIRDVINSPVVLDKFNSYNKREFWKENCLGNKESWEVETISFYPDKHELDKMNLERFFDIDDFEQLNGNGVIAGTVIDKDRQKNIVYLSTQYGVVPVKFWKNLYNKYNQVFTNGLSGNKRVVYENSWFDIGTKLVCVGYRQKGGQQFFLSTKFSQYQFPLFKIITNGNKLSFIGMRYDERQKQNGGM